MGSRKVPKIERGIFQAAALVVSILIEVMAELGISG
jgi:hypothetical protein